VAVLADLISRVRLELGDMPRQFSYTATGDGISKTFDSKIKPVDPTTLYVTVNGSPVAQPSGYTVEKDLGVYHFVTAPGNGQIVKVEGTSYRYFTDADLTTFINTAIEQHTYGRTDKLGSQMTVSLIPAVEEYPLAILATIEALWALATDSAFDIDITAPDGVVIPRSERYRQLTTLVQQRWDQYKQLSSALNIGLWRIEMGTLRRVSRTTNKLVPVYMPKEIDDSRKPERVYIQNDLNGRTPNPTTAQTYDIAMYQGDSFFVEFDFPFDISPYEWKAQVRTYPNAPALYATFTITIISTSPTLSRLKISLTKDQTEYMPVRAFWDLQATDPNDDTYEVTYIKGQVFTTQEVTLD
jgi:hypothetical protein